LLTLLLLQVNICAHATLAASHALFSSGLVDNNVTIEFVTQSGILTAKKISMINGTSHLKNLQNGKAKDVLHIELDFPADPITELNIDDTSLISQALDGASIVDLKRTQIQHDILVIPNLFSSLLLKID
jgi:predicted PhzF superfamily epimerase YddE/YHI9